MSEPTGPDDDPYRSGPVQPGPPPSDGQPYPEQYPQPPYVQHSYDGPTVGQLRADRPSIVTRLLLVMVVGAVLELVSGVAGLLGLGDDLDQASVELDESLADSGIDPATFTSIFEGATVGIIVLTTVIGTGLWLLFAWLFSNGRGRVVGTVLGGINGVGGLAGLIGLRQPLDIALAVVLLAAIAVALVLLWRPATSAWFRGMSTARAAGATGAAE